jgi:hypothetical protein
VWWSLLAQIGVSSEGLAADPELTIKELKETNEVRSDDAAAWKTFRQVLPIQDP